MQWLDIPDRKRRFGGTSGNARKLGPDRGRTVLGSCKRDEPRRRGAGRPFDVQMFVFRATVLVEQTGRLTGGRDNCGCRRNPPMSTPNVSGGLGPHAELRRGGPGLAGLQCYMSLVPHLNVDGIGVGCAFS